MLRGFRDFLLRGNVIDLAVAVVMGLAFNAVVTAFANDFIAGIVGALGGTPDFGALGWHVNGSHIVIGSTINALIHFVIVGFAVYFFVVVPVNRLEAMRRRGQGPEPAATPEDIQLLREIRDLLSARRGGGDV